MHVSRFNEMVSKMQRRRGVLTPAAFVAAHMKPRPLAPAGQAAFSAAVRQGASRDDVRTSAAIGPAIDVVVASGSTNNIFASISTHGAAAATLATAAQRASGFNASVPADSVQSSFLAYIEDFETAPHWTLERSDHQTATHDNANHSQFVEDLTSLLVQQLEFINATQDTITSVSNSIQGLAERVSSSANQTVTDTLYATFTISRSGSDDSESEIRYGIFYTILTVSNQENSKANIITVDADGYAFLFALNSDLLIAEAEVYNQLEQVPVSDWVNSHTI